MAGDNFKDYSVGLADPPRNAVAITPDDATDLTNYTRGIHVGVAGDVKVDMVNSGQVTFKAPVGILWVQAKRVYSTGTTATNLIALW